MTNLVTSSIISIAGLEKLSCRKKYIHEKANSKRDPTQIIKFFHLFRVYEEKIIML